MATVAAIQQRPVDLREVALYEQLGFCFGRKPVEYVSSTEVTAGLVNRIYQ
jgi:6-phosphofructokinase 1